MTPFEKTFNLMKKPWLIMLYTLIVVLTYTFIDKSLATYFYQFDLRTKVHALNFLTALGQWIAYVFLFLLAVFYFRWVKINPVYEGRAWYLLGCILVANIICFVLKITLSRARPELWFTSNEFGFYWFQFHKSFWSFPSGHTITVTSLAAGLGVLFPRYFYGILFAAVLVAASRVLLYYHYLSDVLTAFYLGILIIGFFTHYLKKNKEFH